MSDVTFVTGWAGRKELFPQLCTNARHIAPFVDASPMSILADCTGGDVLFGWSTGAHILLGDMKRLSGCYGLIVLAAPFMDFRQCVGENVVFKMKENLRAFPERTVRSFYRNCGIRNMDSSWAERHVDALAEGLGFLLDSQVAVPEGGFSNVVVIGGVKDRIVPPAEVQRIASRLDRSRYFAPDAPHFISEEKIDAIIHEATGRRIL